MATPRLRWTFALALAPLAIPVTAGAATATVDCARLVPAISAANMRPGPDTIDLGVARTCRVGEPLSRPGGTGAGALPVITGSLTIKGRGSLVVPARNATAQVLRVTNDENGEAGGLVVGTHDLTVRCGPGSGPGGLEGNKATIILKHVVLECGGVDSAGHHGQGRFDVTDSTVSGDLSGGFGTVTRSRAGRVLSNSGYLGSIAISASSVGDVDARSAYTRVEDSTVRGGVAGNAPMVRRSTVAGTVLANGDPEYPGEAGVEIEDSSVGTARAAYVSLQRSSAQAVVVAQGRARTLTLVNSAVLHVSGQALSTLELRNATVASAALSTDGGTILNSTLPRGGIEGASSVRSSIVGGECPFSGPEENPPVVPAGLAAGNVYPDLRDRACPGTASTGNPRLGALGKHGGPTPTYAVGAGSSAVDVVPASVCTTTDQRGVARPQGPRCDAGAFEQRPARMVGSRASFVFAPTAVTRSSVPIAGTLANVGDLPATGVSLSVTPGFAVAAGSCTTTLAPRSSCTGSVQFRPTVVRPYAGRLRIQSDVGTIDVPLSGRGMSR